jgi:protein gp37
MSTSSKIEWTEATWNPILGCAKVSPGCDRCYAIPQATIRAANPHPDVAAAFAGLTERTAGGLDWTGRVNLIPDRLTQPLRWRKPRRVFVNSLADLFHEAVPDEYIAAVFGVMAQAPQHTFQLLTKRHGRMRSLLGGEDFRRRFPFTWPLPNVWLGVSVEDQQWADIRIPALLATPAAVRWLSCEPLLGPVDLHAHDDGLHHWLPDFGPQYDDGSGEPVCQGHGVSRGLHTRAMRCTWIDWLVAGGESGPGARPMHPDWARTLRDQCEASGVPFFFKQHGAWAPVEPDVTQNRRESDWTVQIDGYHYPITEPHESPGGGSRDATVRRVGKRAAGRVLDGRTWDQYPAVAS